MSLTHVSHELFSEIKVSVSINTVVEQKFCPADVDEGRIAYMVDNCSVGWVACVVNVVPSSDRRLELVVYDTVWPTCGDGVRTSSMVNW